MVGPGRLGFPSSVMRVRQCNYCVFWKYFLQDPALFVQTMLDDFHVAEQPKPGHVFSLFWGVPKAEQKQISHFCKALRSEGNG